MTPTYRGGFLVDADGYLTSNELAERYTIHERTVANWRTTGFGPKFVKIGSSVRYRASDVKAWEESRTAENTTQGSALRSSVASS